MITDDVESAATSDHAAEHVERNYYRSALEFAVGVPFVESNRVEPLQNGVEIFPAMLDAIDGARRTIDLVTYVYWRGDIATRFAAALSSKARQGVTVRVLLDSFGAKTMPAVLVDQMENAGVEVRWFRPLATWKIRQSERRTHRKLLICDDEIGFTGGVGIASEWEGDARGPDEWRDTHVRLEGRAVTGLRAAFLDNWNEAGPWLWEEPPDQKPSETGSVPVLVLRASTTIGSTDTASLVRALIEMSRRKLRVVTAYFAPDAVLEELLANAARRGVDVQVLMPGAYCDSRLSQLAGHDSVERLLAARVGMWRYQMTMLHSKVVLVDDYVTCIGSANFNHRSMGKDEECCIVALSESLAAGLGERFDRDCENAALLDYRSWRSRGVWLRVKERLARGLIEHL